MNPDTDRMIAIDIARGVAVMGILAMNIIAFAMPEAAYINPAAWGGTNAADIATWAVSFILIDGKMRGLFSMLFGAGVLLVMDRAEMAGQDGRMAQIMRAFWLAIIGLAHYLLLWWGDILALYALVGLIAMPFAGKEPIALVKLAFLAFALHFAVLMATTISVYHAQSAALAPGASAAVHAHFARTLDGIGQPGTVSILKEVALMRGDYAGIVADKAAHLPDWLLNGLHYTALDTLGFMLLGMAMLKGGFLTGEWPAANYFQTARHCFLIALPIMIGLALWVIWSGFDTVTTFAAVFTWAFPLRIPLTVGATGLIFWLVVRARPGALLQNIAAVGRTALSNYLATSLVMTFLFYGWGLCLFGTVSRAQTSLFMLGMWGVMLLWSQPFLGRFRYGPAEWLWRSLAQGKVLPIVRKS